MKRNAFIRSLATMTGGAFILGCDSDMIEALVPSQTLGDISLEEAQDWVLKEYLPRFSNENARLSDKEYKQELKWKSAKKLKKADGQEFVWVPVEAPKNTSLAVVSWDDTTEYRRKLPKCYFQPVIQGLIVIEEKGKKQAYLAQVAYDPFELKKKKAKLTLADFTGTLLLADWDNTLLEGRSLTNGQVQKSFAANSAKGGRQRGCHQEYYEYQVVTVDSCGVNCTEVTVTLVRGYQTVCAEGGDFGGGGAGGYYGPSTELGNGGGGSSGGGSGGGNTGGVPLIIPGPTYNLQNALTTPGPDRVVFNTQMKDALYATGLALDVTDWSLDKAEAFARSVGGNVDDFFPYMTKVGVGFSVAGIAISGTQLYMGIVENGWQANEDGWNLAQFALAGVGLAATLAAAPWIAVAAGGVSLVIAVTHLP